MILNDDAAAPREAQTASTKLPMISPDDREKTTILAAAVAAGRLPGEPAKVLRPSARRSALTWVLGRPVHSPLADPRLEVVRAISASLARGLGHIRADLAAAAEGAGLTSEEIGLAFPGIRFEQAR